MLRALLSLVVLFFVTIGMQFPAYAATTGEGQFSDAQLLIGPLTVDEDGNGTRELGIYLTFDEGWKTYWRSPGDAGFPLTVDASTSSNMGEPELHWPYPHRFVEEWGLEVFGFKHELVLPMTVPVPDPESASQLDMTVSYAVCSDICITEEVSFSTEIAPDVKPTEQALTALTKANAKVPQSNGRPGFAVVANYVLEEEKEKGGILFVKLSNYTGSFTKAPEVFVEGPPGIRFPKTEPTFSKDKKRAEYRIPYEISLPAKTLYGHTPTLTAVYKDQAIEAPLEIAVLHKGGHDHDFAEETEEISGEEEVVPVEEKPSIELWLALVFAVIGGLILNIMPCVLPVLSIKLLGVVKHGGGNVAEVRNSFLASVVGILISFAVLAAITVSAREGGMAVGWGFHFQSSAFLTFLALLVMFFALNLLGIFEIALPQWLNTHIYDRVGRVAKHRHHLVGDVLTGGLAALMAMPCSAPFLGTAVAYALSRGTQEIWMIFMALGFGLSLPYLAAAIYPDIVTKLPKPGAWMVRVKHLMGLLMGLAAIWLFWVLMQQVGAQLAGSAAALGLAAALLLRVRTRSEGLHRLLVGLAALAVLAASYIVPTTMARYEPMPTAEDMAEAGELHWEKFDRMAIIRHVAAGYVVFVDITADWCLTCKANKLFVLNSPKIEAALREDHVVLMKGDMTVSVPELEAYIKEHGRYGIPFNAVYGPGAENPIILPELLNQVAVLEALQKARDRVDN